MQKLLKIENVPEPDSECAQHLEYLEYLEYIEYLEYLEYVKSME